MIQMHKLKRILDSFLVVKRIFLFGIVVFVGVTMYQFLLEYTFVDRNLILGIVIIWFLTAYIVLPRTHRILTTIYLPNYYIGRARTGEGLLGDPVNLAVIGSEKKLKEAMLADDWVEAEELNFKTTIKMMKASITRKSYPNAPVSSLYLFMNKQSFTYQKEVGGSTSKRHHVRFWKTPEGWMLPGGFTCDWIGAATYDRKVGFSMFTLQITHKIESDTDIERDFVVESLQRGEDNAHVNVIENFSTGYHTKNAGGDTITTDGALPFITLY